MDRWTELPSLVGRVVRLDPMSSADAPGLLAAADHDDVFTWLWTPRPRDEAQAATLVMTMLEMPGVHPWTIRDAATQRVIGMSTLYDIDPDRLTAAIGYTWLSRSLWGSGVNREVKLLQLTHAFETLGCVRVVWHVDALNLRSQAAVERLGATREGTLRKHKRRRDGSWRDTVLFSMVDEEWAGIRSRLQSQASAPTSGRSSPK